MRPSQKVSIFTIHIPESCIKVTQLSKFVHTCQFSANDLQVVELIMFDDYKGDSIDNSSMGVNEADVLPLNYSRSFDSISW
jgi:hypothetical protein